MTRYRTPTAVLLAFAVIVIAACATTVSPLVRMEQGLTDSLDISQFVVQADYDQAAACRAQKVAVSPTCSPLEAKIHGAHKVANDLRTLYPPALQASNAAVNVYREALAVKAAIAASSTATPEQKAAADAAVADALGKANAALANLAVYVAEANGVWTTWNGGK